MDSPRRETFGGGRPAFLALTAAAVLAGLFLRWRMVSLGRSLWLDPAMLAANVVERGYLGLFRPLAENQAAPYGFLVLLKTAGRLADYSEASLLFFPFLFAVVALLLFARLALELLGEEAAPFAVWPLAVSSTAVYYAGEVKQYSADLCATTLLLWLALRCARSGLAARETRIFAAGAIAAAWMSHASFLVAPALLASLWLAGRREPAAQRRVSFWAAAVLAHHTLVYLLQMRKAAGADLFAYHFSSFAPWPPWNDWAFYQRTALGYLEFPLGSPGAIALPLLGAALGLLALRRHRLEALLVLLPLLAALAAASLRLYPLPAGEHDVHSRLLLFSLPSVCLLIGRGFGSLVAPGRFEVALVLLAALVYPAAARSFGKPPYLREEMAPLVADLRQRLAPGDQVYVYHAAIPAFRFYTRGAPIEHLAGQPIGKPENDLPREAARLGAGRVWTVFAHFYAREDEQLGGLLAGRGELLEYRAYPGAVLALYRLGLPKPDAIPR